MKFLFLFFTLAIRLVYGAGPPGIEPTSPILNPLSQDQGRSELISFPTSQNNPNGGIIENQAPTSGHGFAQPPVPNFSDQPNFGPPNVGDGFAPPPNPGQPNFGPPNVGDGFAPPPNPGPQIILNSPPLNRDQEPLKGNNFASQNPPNQPTNGPQTILNSPPLNRDQEPLKGNNFASQNPPNQPTNGKFQFRGDNGGERAANTQDYDYQSFDFTAQKDLKIFTSPLYRVHNVALKRFYSHTNRRDIDMKKRQGFDRQTNLGRMIPMLGWLKRKKELLQKCPDLIELQYLSNSLGRQLLTVSSQRAETFKRGGAWRQFSSLGVCAKRSNCGATEPLFELIGQRAQDGDAIYVSTKNEYDKLIQKGNYRDERKQKPVCYIWPK